jgi:3-phenylpropionate/trans-cinnamate dioxygenase ferredoxin reductase subunit
MSSSPSMPDRSVDFLLVGGGMASANCARWLRRSGAEGSIVIVGREPDLPYERPPLSKGYLRGEEPRSDALAQPPEFYVENEIEVLTKTSVMKLDLDRREATLSNKQQLRYERLLLATGANVRRLNVPGAELEGIHYLRTFANSDAIRADAAGKRVVLIGGSYIAAEVAASLTEMGTEASLVMLEPVVLSRSFGEPAGRFFHDLLVQHGIEIGGTDSLARFEGADGRVQRVVTESGRTLEADAVIVGAGVVPDVMLARRAGLELGDSGGIRVDSKLQTATEGVFAAGDVAEYESVIHGGRRIRVEHWDVAFNQGKFAALNMLGRERDYDVVPYFFSDLSDWASIEYVGPAHDWDQEIFRGSVDDGEFSVFYLDGGRVAAALSVGRPNDLQAARRLIASGQDISGRTDELADLSTDLDEF